MTVRRPRVLAILNGADDTLGGSLRAAVNTAEAMVRAGADVTFIAPLPPSGVTTRTIDSVRDTIDVRLFPASKVAARWGGSLRQLLWLIRNVRKYDVVQLHIIFFAAGLYVPVVCKLARVPYYYWPHGGLLDYDMQKHQRVKAILGPALWRWVLAGATGLLCTTRREARELRTFGANPPRHVASLPVTPPPDEPIPRAEWRARYDIAEDAFVVLFFGRVDKKKRLDLAVEALALLPEDTVLAVVGATESPELDTIRKQAADLGVADRLRVVGWVDGPARAGAFPAADCFLLPSDNENFGLATAEALLMHVPAVISTEVFISEELAAADAALVADRDPAAIASAVLTLRNDPDAARAMADRAYAQARELYDPDRVGVRILDYCRLLPGQTAPRSR